MTLDIACQNFMVHTGCSVCDAFRFASTNPANLLGQPFLGRIGKNCVADIIIVDDKFNVKKVIKKGDIL